MSHVSHSHTLATGGRALRLVSTLSCALLIASCASTPGGSGNTGDATLENTAVTGRSSAFPAGPSDSAAGAVAGPGAGAAGGSMSSSSMSSSSMSQRGMESMLAAWPAKQRESAMMLVAKYGAPNVAGDQVMIWYNKGPYLKIELARNEVMHNFPAPHPDYLTSTVKYKVPTDKLDELGQYDGSVWFHRTRGELSAQCDKEEANNLALNLSHDIATGRRTVADARAFYAKTAMAMMAGDKSSPYLTGIMFQPNANSADMDMAHKM